jgi:hypothetical protein
MALARATRNYIDIIGVFVGQLRRSMRYAVDALRTSLQVWFACAYAGERRVAWHMRIRLRSAHFYQTKTAERRVAWRWRIDDALVKFPPDLKCTQPSTACRAAPKCLPDDLTLLQD